MARRVNAGGGESAPKENASGGESAPKAEKSKAPAAVVGGAEGVIPDAVKEIGGGAGKVEKAAPIPPDAPPSPPAKRYEVYGCGPNGKSVLLNGYKALFRDGKIVEETHWDVNALFAQGISLREIS